MENERGTSIILLVIVTILIMIGAGVLVSYAQKMMEETKLQDLRTNMFVIQAEAKKGLEEVCFRTVNIDESKEENIMKINEIKKEYLDGILLNDAPEEVKEAIKDITNVNLEENCYYLDEAELIDMGIKEIDKNQFGYFIVKYDFETTGVEVINTNGYEGNYTLTQLNELIEGMPEGEPVS